jgi:hypothetical protein
VTYWRISADDKGIDLVVTLSDLHLPDDVFFERYIKPALAVLRNSHALDS